MMNTWILQGGHPLVTLENGTISQKPFAYGAARVHSAIGASWLVPVLTRSLKGGPTTRHLLADTPLRVSDEVPVVLNASGSGVYRSRYGEAELAALTSHIGELEEIERATLLADSWASLFAGQITWDAFVASARGLGNQDEPNPWGTVAVALDYAKRALLAEQHTKLAAVVRQLFAPQFERLGWDAKEGESDLTPQLRAIVLGALGTVGEDEEIRKEAARRFDANDLDGDLARTVLRIVGEQNRAGDYDTFLERYKHAQTPQEEQRYLWGLANFADEALALDAAERCYHEFRNQDGASVLGILSRNSTTGPSVWRYLTSRWQESLERFPANTQTRLTLGVPTFIKDPAFAQEVASFHESHPLSGEQRTVDQAIEQMRVGLSFTTALRSQF
jgi:aminopeptidase N